MENHCGSPCRIYLARKVAALAACALKALEPSPLGVAPLLGSKTWLSLAWFLPYIASILHRTTLSWHLGVEIWVIWDCPAQIHMDGYIVRLSIHFSIVPLVNEINGVKVLCSNLKAIPNQHNTTQHRSRRIDNDGSSTAV